MATYGKFEVTPVSGVAGTTEVSAKLATANTGRAEYIKYAKHYMTNETSKFASITLKAARLDLGRRGSHERRCCTEAGRSAASAGRRGSRGARHDRPPFGAA